MKLKDLPNKMKDATTNIICYAYISNKDGMTAYRLTNNINIKIKNTYAENLSKFTENKSVKEYDTVHDEKGTIKKLNIEELELWPIMLACMDRAEEQGLIINNDNIGSKFNFLISQIEYTDEEDKIKYAYLLAKYRNLSNTYKKGFRLCTSNSVLQEFKKEIFLIDGTISAIIIEDNIYILSDSNFESLFKYTKKADTILRNHKEDIESWAFIDNTTEFYKDIIKYNNSKIKMARALTKNEYDFTKLTPDNVKSALIEIPEFNDVEYDENNKIIYTSKIKNLLVSLINQEYAKSLFTDDLIKTKGV